MAQQASVTGTAFGPMFIVAVEQFTPFQRRIVVDPLAQRLLPASTQAVLPAARWKWFREQLVAWSDRRFPGLWGSLLCRKRYGDDAFVEATRRGIPQLVLLGAGLDDRAYRRLTPQAPITFELDLPANIQYKRRRLLRIFGRLPAHVRLAPIDFESADIGGVLRQQGFRFDAPALFIWEAVTQYLTESGVRRTLRVLSEAATGSRLLFTYVRREFLEGANLWGSPALYRQFVGGSERMWKFGLTPGEVAPLLGECGWQERDQAGQIEYEQRYVRPTGRRLRVTDLERFVSAERAT